MSKHEHELIAMLLGDAAPSPPLERWLATAEGARALAAYRRTLGDLERLYRGTPAPRPAAFWTSLATPIGRVLVAATDRGLVRVSFRRSEASFVAEIARGLGLAPVRAPEKTAEAVSQLRAYFAGTRRRFELPVDLDRLSPFHRRVLQATARVPAGRLVSYGEIARRIGRPGGSRAVGQALGRNPLPIVIPCHRVVASGGRIGGYTGGLDVKRKLLRLEGTLGAVG
jgi:methylated-DNA-[protein]-cysteine S-methyltransferase